MARTWLTIRVDLVDGMHAHDLWPRPGRILIARPGMTFRMLADAINEAFARWDRGHLHAFTQADGTRIAYRGPWDDFDDGLDDTQVTLSRLALGEQFVFEFDFGDSWMHLCTVGPEKVDPGRVYGRTPDHPVAIDGWGWIPDQYGRRWDNDDHASPMPAEPDPPLSDLPDLHYRWGSQAFRVPNDPESGTLVVGPWSHTANPGDDRLGLADWSPDDIKRLRAALATHEPADVVQLVEQRDALEVAHLAGPGLLEALAAGHAAVEPLVERLSQPLAQRGWLGDDELVGEFDRLSRGLDDMRRVCPVDLDELAHHLDGPTEFDEGWLLEVATGTFWPRDPEGMIGESRTDDFDDPDAFLTVIGIGSGSGYGDMRDFIGLVTDEVLADKLAISIQGKGAFKRFRAALFEHEDWWTRWSTFSNERRLGRARSWLSDAGFRPAVHGEPLR